MEGDAETLRARCEAPHTSETLTALVGDEAFLGSLRSSELTRLDLSGTNAARLDESWGGYRKLLLALPSTLTSLALPIGIGSSGYEGWDDGMGSVFRESEVRGAGCCYGRCVRCSLASKSTVHSRSIHLRRSLVGQVGAGLTALRIDQAIVASSDATPGQHTHLATFEFPPRGGGLASHCHKHDHRHDHELMSSPYLPSSVPAQSLHSSTWRSLHKSTLGPVMARCLPWRTVRGVAIVLFGSAGRGTGQPS